LSSPPFRSATFEAAARTHPDLHPAQAAMRALAGPKGPTLSAADLRARRDAELRFFGVTDERRGRYRSLEVLAQGIHRRWDHRIAAAERREARETRLGRIEATLAEAEARLAAPARSATV
jgi:hypothetical protein